MADKQSYTQEEVKAIEMACQYAWSRLVAKDPTADEDLKSVLQRKILKLAAHDISHPLTLGEIALDLLHRGQAPRRRRRRRQAK